MYCLIVEDERQTREGLMRLIPWARIGINRLECAVSGRDALAKMRLAMPDLLLCDIRMPQMNGVDMVGTLREEGNPIPVVFMSGFSDKEYLKAAIRYGAVEYIEKPISIDQLTNVLAETVQRLGSERVQADPHLATRIAQGASPESTLRQHLIDIGHPLLTAGSLYGCLLVQPSDSPGLSFIHLRYLLSTWGWPILVDQESAHHHILIAGQHGDVQPDFDALMMRINQNGGGYTLAVGAPVPSIACLPASMEDARRTAMRIYFGRVPVLHTVPHAPEEAQALAGRCLRHMVASMERRQYHALRDGLEELGAALQKTSGIYPEDVRAMLQQIHDVLLDNVSIAMRAEIERDGGLRGQWNTVMQSQHLREAIEATQRWVEYLVDQYFGLMAYNPAVIHAIRHINDHYAKHITMDDLARVAFVSTSHLSCLFRHEIGSTIKQYITQMRLEKARILLRSPTARLADIPCQVGIPDASYFAKLFRKAEGIAPSAYREKHCP